MPAGRALGSALYGFRAATPVQSVLTGAEPWADPCVSRSVGGADGAGLAIAADTVLKDLDVMLLRLLLLAGKLEPA